MGRQRFLLVQTSARFLIRRGCWEYSLREKGAGTARFQS